MPKFTNIYKQLNKSFNNLEDKFKYYRYYDVLAAKMNFLGDLGKVLGVFPAIYNTRNACGSGNAKPKHLICFKQWTTEMVLDVVNSALCLKKQYPDTHMVKLDLLKNANILIIEEVNEPILFAVVSKAASFLGAEGFGVVDRVLWDSDYNGRVFSAMSDAIFVSTITHGCIQRLAARSIVPVLCVKSRAHASIQSLAIVMTVMEELDTLKNLNFAYIGPPLQVLNSMLLLCPMLGANISFKCSCAEAGQSPLLYKMSKDIVKEKQQHTKVSQCASIQKALKNANVIIAGPISTVTDKKHFWLTEKEINCNSKKWMFIHCCPRGEGVDDELFYSKCSHTFHVFDNMQYIAAALLAYCIKDHKF